MTQETNNLLTECCLCKGLFNQDSITTLQFDTGQLDFCFNCEEIQEEMAENGVPIEYWENKVKEILK